MPASLDVGRYPRQFMDIAEEFSRPEAPVRVKVLECVDERAAKRLRLRLYQFKGALAAAQADKEYHAHGFLVVSIYVEGPRLRLVHADDTFNAVEVT